MHLKTKIGALAGAAATAALCFVLIFIFCAVPGTAVASPVTAAAECAAGERLLIPGGMSFGVRFFTDGVLVVGFGDTSMSPAYAAGVRVNDVILRLDGKPVGGAADLTEAVSDSGGKPLTLTCRREGREFNVTLTPVRSDGDTFRAGMWVRDSGAGIGTVTFIDPKTGGFGGLGHGICDADTGKPVPLGRGTVVGVSISGITRGVAGTPGEIRGYFEPEKLGSVISNTEHGVFGVYGSAPAGLYGPMPTASPREVKEGKASILCTLDTGVIREYDVEIYAVDRSAAGGRCFSVRVTDPRLLECTGGIVQGMSGSPVLQNGKLIGAVTHVLINDPTGGYGIFIDNMLASMPDALK